MALSKEEITKIGKEAAQRKLAERCLTIATDIDSVRSDGIDRLHTLIYNYGVSLSRPAGYQSRIEEKKADLLKSIKNAQDAVQQSIIDTGYAQPKHIEDLTDRLVRVYQLVEEGKLYDAISMVEVVSDDVFKLMLRTVVACECGQIKESIKSSADVG